MSDKIHQLIKDVRVNFSSMNESLLAEKSKNQEINAEVSELKNQIESLISENKVLKVEIDDFKKRENDVNEEVKLQTQQTTMVSEESIDELVKEIDYCIGQLKK